MSGRAEKSVKESAIAPTGLNSFDVGHAEEAADRVFYHDPSVPFLQASEPVDEDAARVAVRRLGQLFEQLPASIRRALRGAEINAGQLSDDRLQGLAEMIQNADDVGATIVRLAVVSGQDGNFILCSHDGGPLLLQDVLGLATPWLSMKTADPESLGRFGIGLMTLRSLSELLEVHCSNIS